MKHEITPYEDFDLLEFGRAIHEGSYKREKKEFLFDTIKIDLIKFKGKTTIIGEIKKSSSYLLPAKMQLLFYMYRLNLMGVSVEGEILVPKEKKKQKVSLTEENRKNIEFTLEQIRNIIRMPIAPKLVKIRFCDKCAYRDFCFA